MSLRRLHWTQQSVQANLKDWGGGKKVDRGLPTLLFQQEALNSLKKNSPHSSLMILPLNILKN
ncbi:hypothetical protein D7X25_13060 [bacterium 1XD42-8]|nr:hypothetical protein D7X25_13060 [bacterium 1XD42-8]